MKKGQVILPFLYAYYPFISASNPVMVTALTKY